MKRSSLRVGIFGASGAVGRQVMEALQESHLDIASWHVFASESARGRFVSLQNGTSLPLQSSDLHELPSLDLAFVAVPMAKAKPILDKLRQAKIPTIDMSQSLALEPKIPLAVAGIHEVVPTNLAVASPLPLVVALNQALFHVHKQNPLRQLHVVALQGVSHAGRSGMSELMNQTKDSLMNKPSPVEVFHKSIAFNMIPQCGNILKSGLTHDEDLLCLQVRKTLGSIADIKAHLSWVPIFHGCGCFISLTCERALAKADVIALWKKNPYVAYDGGQHEIGPMSTPMDAQGEDRLFISRLQIDPKNEKQASFWMTYDNLRFGSSINAIRIAESLFEG